MAYIVYCDDVPIYDLRGEELVLIDPELTLEVNKAGEFKFKIPPNHRYYDLPQKMKSKIQVFQDGQEIFNGRPVQVKSDFYKRKQVVCEGQLAFLNDSVQRPAEYHDLTVRQYLQTLLTLHNNQVDESRQFELGIVTVKDSNDSLYRYTNMNSTMTELKEDLIDDLGGYLKVRNVYDSDRVLQHRYLDYVTIDDYGFTNTQVINFGENLLDFTRDIDMTDICTAIIPLGARQEESEFSALEVRLTIESVNNGVDYIQVDEAVNTYGFIVKTVTWDDVNVPSLLLSKARRYLSDYQFENMVIEAQAVDLHYTDVNVEAFHLGDRIRVKSNPHGLDRYFPLTKMTIYLNKLGSNKITLGNDTDITLSTKTNKISAGVKSATDSIPVPSAIVKSAVEQATALITAATHGHVVTTADEQLIMDTNDVETATKVWRWNLNGLGYSRNGYNGTYDTAITMDGQIVGDRLVGGSVSAEKLDINYRTSVEKRITESMEAAEENSITYTDDTLKSYWKRAEVETAIKNTADSVLLSAKETATTYVDGQLKNYSTSAQIKVTTDAITTEVNKKVGYSEVISAINQSAETVSIKASKIKLEGVVTANKGFSIDTAGNMTAKNGTFTGNVTGSTITGSSIRFLYSDGQTEYISLSSMGLIMDGQKAPYGISKGGYFKMSTTWGWFLNCTSPIMYAESKEKAMTDGNSQWFAVFSRGCNKFRFVWQVTSSSYVEIQTLYGAYGLTAWISDAKLKENIQVSELNAIDEIMKIPHFSFDWKNKKLHSNCGYIAQEMEKLNSSYVLSLPQTDANGNRTGDMTYQIDETNIIPVITKAIQELVKRVQILERGVSDNG